MKMGLIIKRAQDDALFYKTYHALPAVRQCGRSRSSHVAPSATTFEQSDHSCIRAWASGLDRRGQTGKITPPTVKKRVFLSMPCP
jgi:hypothetical protein